MSNGWPMELMSGHGLLGFVLSWVAVAVAAIGLVWIVVCRVGVHCGCVERERL